MALRWLRRFVAEEDGPTAVEYALMLGGLIMMCIAGIGALGGANQAFWLGNLQAISKAFLSGG